MPHTGYLKPVSMTSVIIKTYHNLRVLRAVEDHDPDGVQRHSLDPGHGVPLVRTGAVGDQRQALLWNFPIEWGQRLRDVPDALGQLDLDPASIKDRN